MESSSIEDIEGLLGGVIKDIEGQIKLIRIADQTEGGWATVEEYQTSDLAEDSDDDKKIHQANALAVQKKRKLQHRPSLTRGDMGDRYSLFRPHNTPRGEQRNQMKSVFDAGQKVISGVTAECKSRLESNLGEQESKLSNNQFSGGHRRFLSHWGGLYLSHRQEVQEIQQPEVKHNFSSHDPNDVCTVPEFEYHEQSNNDNNVKGRLRLRLDFWKWIGAYENIIDTVPFIETPFPDFF